jgi:hypothetical protein
MWHRWYWYVVTNASEERFEGRRFVCNLASVYQTSRCHIPEDRVVNTQQPARSYNLNVQYLSHTVPSILIEGTESNCSSPSSKEGKLSSEYDIVSLHLKFLGVVLSRWSVCLLQVSLCDEYSLPVDFVNKRRPHSFGAGLANWTTPSPNGEQVTEIFS